jgi:hypothetical protein
MSGFANTAPQGRAMRMDKDTLEKDMLRQRTGGFQKHEVYDGPITVPEADGLGYAGDADRFQTDAASADAEVRGGDMARKDQMYADRRYVPDCRGGRLAPGCAALRCDCLLYPGSQSTVLNDPFDHPLTRFAG